MLRAGVGLAALHGTQTSRSVSRSRGVPPAAVVRAFGASSPLLGTVTATGTVQCSVGSSGGAKVTVPPPVLEGPSADTAATSSSGAEPTNVQLSIASRRHEARRGSSRSKQMATLKVHVPSVASASQPESPSRQRWRTGAAPSPCGRWATAAA